MPHSTANTANAKIAKNKSEKLKKDLAKWKNKSLKGLTNLLSQIEDMNHSLNSPELDFDNENNKMKLEALNSSKHINLITYAFYKLFNSIEMITHETPCKIDLIMTRIMQFVLKGTYYFTYNKSGSPNNMMKALAYKGVNTSLCLEKCELSDEYNNNFDCCSICLEGYEVGDKIALLPCRHHCHSQCVSKWILKNANSSIKPSSMKVLDKAFSMISQPTSPPDEIKLAEYSIKKELSHINCCPMCRSNLVDLEFSQESVSAYTSLLHRKNNV